MSRHTPRDPFRESFRDELEMWAFIVFRTEAKWAQVTVVVLYTLLLVGIVLGAVALLNGIESRLYDPIYPCVCD